MAVCACGRGNRGQVLIVTSLVVVMLLVSAVVYVNETQRNTPVSQVEGGFGLAALKQSLAHAVLSGLVNASIGGNESALLSNLDQLKSVLITHAYDALLDVQCAPLNDSGYRDGVWLDWSQSGRGVSSACVDFALNSSGTLQSYFSEFSVNVTSSLAISGTYFALNGSVQVTASCRLWNEGEAAVAGGFEVYFAYGAAPVWREVASENVTATYGADGGYLLSFTANVTGQVNPLQVSVHAVDARGVSVWANATLTQA